MFLKKKTFNPNQPVQQIVKRKNKKLRVFLWTIFILLFGVIGWIGASGLLALNNISAKNTDDSPSFFKYGGSLTPEQLVSAGSSRINILTIGADNAAGLTDSLQVISIDPINNSLAILSVPRDLYVKDSNGSHRKINEVYNANSRHCSKTTSSCDPDIDYGAEALMDVLKAVLGVDIHYFARVDFDGLKKLVDAVGGVQIYVDTALSDPTYPNKTNTGFEPLYIPAGLQTMNGDTALKYARCRKGTCGNDFGRSSRQQKVLLALKDKLASINVLANPKKLTSIISAVGNHLKTNLTVEEMIRLYGIVKDAKSSEVGSAVLDNGPDAPLQSSNNGQYVLIPKAGQDNYSEVHDFVAAALQEPYIIKEAATVTLVNATGSTKAGETVKELLVSLGYKISVIVESGSTQTSSTITENDQKPYTFALLKNRYNTTTTKANPYQTDITLTIGKSYLSD